jgi:hypothetical protein
LRISKLVLGSVAVAALLIAPLSGVAAAKPPKNPHPHPHPHAPNNLTCFDGHSEGTIYGGHCTIKGHPKQGPATLDNRENDPDGDYAGVYIPHSTLSGKLLGKVKKLGYHYKGNVKPTPGDLSLNVPLDENNNGSTEEYAFVDAFYCPGHNGHVDIIKDSHCGIYVGGVTFYPNWKALVTAHPTWKVATDNPPILIAERTPSEPPAKWTVDHVQFGK